MAACAVVACGERDRLLFPVEDPGDGTGPFTNITHPGVVDTVVVEGDLLFVTGFSIDPDGVDSVFFEITGAGQSFSPLDGNGADSVPFAFQLSTIGHSGGSILIRTFAKDGLGDLGPAVIRSVKIE